MMKTKSNVEASKKYRDSHDLKESRAKYYEDNKQQAKAYYLQYREKNIDKMRQQSADYKKNNPEKFWLTQIKTRAKKRNLEFNLTEEDFVVPDICPVLSIPLVRAEGRVTDCSPTMDRIVPELGYVKGNVIIVSWLANRIKNNADIETLCKVGDFYRQFS